MKKGLESSIYHTLVMQLNPTFHNFEQNSMVWPTVGRQAVRLNVIRNSLGLQLQLVQRRLLHQLEESVLLKMGIDLWNAPTQILQIHLLRYSRPGHCLVQVISKNFYFKTGRLNWVEQAKGQQISKQNCRSITSSKKTNR